MITTHNAMAMAGQQPDDMASRTFEDRNFESTGFAGKDRAERELTGKPILLIEDDATLNRLMVAQLERAGYRTRGVLRAQDAVAVIKEDEPVLILLDIRLPDRNGLDFLREIRAVCPVIVITAHGAISQAVTALRLGAHDYLTKPIRSDELELSIERALDHARLKRSGDFMKGQIQSLMRTAMIGSSPAFREVQRQIRLFGPTDAAILLFGESGAGKKQVARALHDASDRAAASYVVLDCSTVQEHLFESELFGYERGAFAGADQRKPGLIEIAEGGTVFLDEIGALALPLQAKLLRLLETGTFRRLGGVTDLPANVRFIAATHRDIIALGREGQFRIDLYYRLSRFEITVPPLRDRGEDAVEIARHLIKDRTVNRGLDKVLDAGAIRALRTYRWPGNIRELKNVIERAVVLSGEEQVISAAMLGLDTRKPAKSGTSIDFSFNYLPTIDELQTHYVEDLLSRGTYSRAKIAEALNISERTVYRILKNRKMMDEKISDEPDEA